MLPLVDFSKRSWIMESGPSACECLLRLILQAVLLHTNVTHWRPYLSFSSSTELWRYCPVCVNFMQGKHGDWAIYVRKLVWNQHICEHDSPWSRSMINYLCTEESQEAIFKDQLLCISSFFFFFLSVFIFKGNVCIEYLCACDQCQMREVMWFRKEEWVIKSAEKPQRVVGMWG